MSDASDNVSIRFQCPEPTVRSELKALATLLSPHVGAFIPRSWIPPLLLAPLSLGMLAGCQFGGEGEAGGAIRPLQPLVYTESKQASPKAAAARDRRLMRTLVGSAADANHWGRLDREHVGQPAENAARLGRLLFRGMIEGDAAAWDRAFVSARRYRSLVGVDADRARAFVSELQGDSATARRAFRRAPPARTPAGGVGDLFKLVDLRLGDPKTIGGADPDSPDEVRQYWHNELRLTTTRDQVQFRVRIPKIVRIRRPSADSDDAEGLAIASKLSLGSRLATYLRAGLHLKPELLGASEYPYPLREGNFWRYRRRVSSTDGTETQLDLRAERIVVEVRRIERYGTRRLATLTCSDGTERPPESLHLLATPRRLYRCPASCRRRVDDLSSLLRDLADRTPVLVFPLELGAHWPEGDDTRFRVGDRLRTVETPGGTFYGTFAITRPGSDGVHPYRPSIGELSEVRDDFSPGRGVVRRTYRLGLEGENASATVVDEVTAYRLIPE
ncbi:MAG: hypothetical protein ABEL76_04200 [Bradymonadaceae bacterium]